jgi:hypothetical protein
LPLVNHEYADSVKKEIIVYALFASGSKLIVRFITSLKLGTLLLLSKKYKIYYLTCRCLFRLPDSLKLSFRSEIYRGINISPILRVRVGVYISTIHDLLGKGGLIDEIVQGDF